jgi:hypothetical protein
MKLRAIVGQRLLLPILLAAMAAAGAAAAPAPVNLAANGGFEREELGNVAMWSMDAWVKTDEAVRFFVTTDQKHGGLRSMAIANLQPNDSRVMQWIRVKPDTYYRLSCWIFAQSVQAPSVGANISVLGATVAAGDLRDTRGKWQKVEMVGKTGPRQESVAVLARLGFYGSLATGLALFDDFVVEELPGPPAGAGKSTPSFSSAESLIIQPLPAPAATAQAAEAGPAAAQGAWSGGGISPALLSVLLTVISLLVVAAVVVAAVALTTTLVSRRARSVMAPPGSARIPIAALVSGYGARASQAGGRRGGRRRGDGIEVEHRSWNREPLEAPLTVRKKRHDAGTDTFKLRTLNVSEGGIFIATEDSSILRLDDEVMLELTRDEGKVELGRAFVARATPKGFGLRLGVQNVKIRFLLRGAV